MPVEFIAERLLNSVTILYNVHKIYLSQEDRLKLNIDHKTHNLIYTVYSVIAPEQLGRIYFKLGLVSYPYVTSIGVKYVFLQLHSQYWIKKTDDAFKEYSKQSEIIECCERLDFFAAMASDALQKLQTTL